MDQNYHDLNRYQDCLGQLPILQVYSHILYFFPLPSIFSKEQIVHDLEAAVRKVRQEVPWMGARVINVDKVRGSSGTYRPILWPPPHDTIDIKDVPTALPEYAEVKALKAPLSIIDTKQLTPVPSFPQRYHDSDNDPAYAVRAQISFVRGGVVVDFAIVHNIADAGGHFGFVKMVAMAMRGEEYSDSLLQAANMDRRNIIPLLRPDERMLDHSHHLRPPAAGAVPPAVPSSNPARYHIFRLSPRALKEIKKLASPPGLDVPFISTDDAVCAFFWKQLIAARKDLLAPGTRSRFDRQIDGRRAMGLPADYMGEMAHTVPTWLTLREVLELPLAMVASHLRRRLDETNRAYNLRSFATFVARQPDKSMIAYAGQFNPTTDIGCSSIRGLPDVFPEFGVLGRPDFIRRPPSTPFPSTVVLYPGTPEGHCDAVACLLDDELKALQADESWNRLTEHIE